MPKLNKCIHRWKGFEQGWKDRSGSIHYGTRPIALCLKNETDIQKAPKCTGWNCGSYQEEST